MRRGNFRGRPGSATTAATVCLGFAMLTAAAPTRGADDASDRAIADIAKITDLGKRTVEGVGLAVGLAGTGSDPRPSGYREKLKTEMKRNPELDPERILGDPLKRVSMVLVRADISAGLDPEDELNVEVLLPPGSETTSLEGGYVLEVWLHQVGIASGSQLEGQKWVLAHGPIITGNDADPTDPKVGRILGGGRIKETIPHILVIAEKYRSGMVAKQLEDLINARFQYRDGRFKKGVATAKTDNTLVLNVPERYHHNQLRYFQVLQQLRLKDIPQLNDRRMEDWKAELLDPKTAGAAAIKLEAIGANAAPTLIEGLASEHPQVRFFAAEALAYLDNNAGTEELARTVIEHEEFRTVALAALAAMDSAAGRVRLRELMAHSEPSIRYGAFNALRAAAPTDPALGRVQVAGYLQERRGPVPDEALTYRIDGTPRQDAVEPSGPDPFELYVVRAEGEPLIHVSRSRRREIVLFGEGQRLLPPAVLGGVGPILVNAGLDDDQIEISRIELAGSTPQVLRTSTDLVEVVRCLSALGATYPQVVSILEGASAQANLDAALKVDAGSGDLESYDRALLAGEDVIRDQRDWAEDDDESGNGRRRFEILGRLLPRRGDRDASEPKVDEAVQAAGLEVIDPDSDVEQDEAPGRRRGLLRRFRLFPRNQRP